MAKQKDELAVSMGSRIAARRKQLGLTQEQAAEKAGLTQQFFACAERGIKNIRSESVIKISRALEISADYILTGVSNNLDRNHLTALLEPLDEVQLKCMEEIMKQYLIACGYPQCTQPPVR